MAFRRRMVLPLVFAALLAGPALRLRAASPCDLGAPMACCGSDENDVPAPCGCTLRPATPSPAVVESAPPGVELAVTPAAEAVPEPAAARPPWAEPVTPRARAAPLFVLFAAFLN